MIGDWVVEIDRRLRETAKARMPSEWAKSLPPELKAYAAPERRTRVAVSR
jgi:hypothetical protein